MGGSKYENNIDNKSGSQGAISNSKTHARILLIVTILPVSSLSLTITTIPVSNDSKNSKKPNFSKNCLKKEVQKK